MARDRRPTEYGGRDGVIQRGEDGHVLSAQEQALLMRRYGKRSDTEHVVNATEPGPIGPQVPVGEEPRWGDPERDRLVEEMNGYTEGDIEG